MSNIATFHSMWTFVHGKRMVEIGPFYYQDEAKTEFQRKYGYWPEPAVKWRKATAKDFEGIDE